MSNQKTKEEVFETLKQVIIRTTFTQEISEESTLKDDMDLDSLDSVELMMECEKEFLITIQDAEFEVIKTVEQLLDVICAKLLIQPKP